MSTSLTTILVVISFGSATLLSGKSGHLTVRASSTTVPLLCVGRDGHNKYGDRHFGDCFFVQWPCVRETSVSTYGRGRRILACHGTDIREEETEKTEDKRRVTPIQIINETPNYDILCVDRTLDTWDPFLRKYGRSTGISLLSQSSKRDYDS